MLKYILKYDAFELNSQNVTTKNGVVVFPCYQIYACQQKNTSIFIHIQCENYAMNRECTW